MLTSRDTIAAVVWRPGNALALLALALFPATAPAQSSPGTAPPTPVRAPLLDWSHARLAFQLAESWTSRASVPERPGDPVWVSDCGGVRVTLRHMGLALGGGESLAPGALELEGTAGGRTRAVVDLGEATRQATAAALKEAEATLRAQHDRSGRMQPRGPAGDASPGSLGPASTSPMTVRDAASLLLVEVEVARRPRPVLVAEKAPEGAVLSEFAPGYHGLAVQRLGPGGPMLASWLWPGDAIARNILPPDQLVQLLARVGLPAGDVERLARPGRAEPVRGPPPRLWRFEVIHVVRPAPDEPPLQLVRGAAVLPPTPVTGRTVAAMSERLAQYLLRRQRDDGRFSGMYHPSADRFDPEIAGTQDAALAMYALACRARYLHRHEPDNAQLDAVRTGSAQAIERLAGPATGRVGVVGDPAAAALVVLTLVDAPHLAERRPQRDALLERLLQIQNDDGSFRAAFVATRDAANLPTQALIAAALASAFEQTRDPQLRRAADKVLDWLWQKHAPPQLVSALPWLTMAELRLHRLDMPEDPQARQRWGRRAAGITTLTHLLLARQLTHPADGADAGPADVVGGFDLGRPGPDAPPDPDWRSASLLMALAGATVQPDICKDTERAAWLIRCGLGARFVAQLMFDAPGSYYVRSWSREGTLGGVRPALYDNRLGLAPSAMALLATTELQTALSELVLRPR